MACYWQTNWYWGRDSNPHLPTWKADYLRPISRPQHIVVRVGFEPTIAQLKGSECTSSLCSPTMLVTWNRKLIYISIIVSIRCTVKSTSIISISFVWNFAASPYISMNFSGPDRIRTGTTHRDRVALSTIQPQDQIFASWMGFGPMTHGLKGWSNSYLQHNQGNKRQSVTLLYHWATS